jgi:hypothetical protein
MTRRIDACHRATQTGARADDDGREPASAASHASFIAQATSFAAHDLIKGKFLCLA